MTQIATVLILGVTVEAIIEYISLIFADKTFNWKQVVALILGIGLALLAQVDLFDAVGVTFIVPYVGMVLTGIIFSRGANYAADFIKLIQSKSTIDGDE